jgi:hypothetical protein
MLSIYRKEMNVPPWHPPRKHWVNINAYDRDISDSDLEQSTLGVLVTLALSIYLNLHRCAGCGKRHQLPGLHLVVIDPICVEGNLTGM